MTPYATSVASRSDRTSGATPSLSRNSANLVAPKKASRRIRKVHRSPRTPRLRAIEQLVSGTFAILQTYLLSCPFISSPLGCKNLLRRGKPDGHQRKDRTRDRGQSWPRQAPGRP